MSRLHYWAMKRYVAVKSGEEEGQGLAEYALILALIAVVCIGALTALQGGISTTLGNVTSSL